MKIAKFTYAKTAQDVSERKLAVVVEPSIYYEGVELTKLTDAEIASYAKRINAAKTKYLEEVANINSLFDLSYKKFKEEKVFDVEIEIK